jgi:hypothetical protein
VLEGSLTYIGHGSIRWCNSRAFIGRTLAGPARRSSLPRCHQRPPLHAQPDTPTALLSCEPTCTTTQYKSLTREHIESLGNDIVLNMGDQLNDLAGGFADYTAKVPNPMYYIP